MDLKGKLLEGGIRLGIIRRRKDGTIRWPVDIDPWPMWKMYLFNPGWLPGHDPMIGGWFGVFRNKPGIIKWIPGRVLPRRWGIRILGLEIGDRG